MLLGRKTEGTWTQRWALRLCGGVAIASASTSVALNGNVWEFSIFQYNLPEWAFTLFHVQKHSTMSRIGLTHFLNIYSFPFLYNLFSADLYRQEKYCNQKHHCKFPHTDINHAHLIYYLSFEKNTLQLLCNDFFFYFTKNDYIHVA